ncbi:MAG: hypothetical protein FJX75_12305 [Armatimonadetes bacterium]|nr:hypothetical protein [Armatimonadota bacterium]
MLTCLALLATLPARAQDARDLDAQQNLALGKPVTYLPAPNYGLTAQGGTDSADLTDGKLTQRPDQCMWFESLAVGWSYAGRVNLAVDLGEVQPIDEVAIRFLGGSPQAGIAVPGWVEVMVADSLDGPYYRVAEYSKWRPGETQRFGVPRSEGKAWVHRLRFADLKTRARCVGLRFYGTGLTCADEMYVFKGDEAAAKPDESALTHFTVTQAAIYFHKPMAHITSNIVTPMPIGWVAAPRESEQPMTVSLTVPRGVEILGGSLGGVPLDQAQVADSTYTWTLNTKGASDKVFARLYVTGKPEAGAKPELEYQLTWGAYQSPRICLPIDFIEVPLQPVIPQRLTTSLCWWDLASTKNWPRWEEAFRRIGFNTVPAMATWFDPKDQDTIGFATQVRDKGFRIQAIDSTWHRMLERHRTDPELYCQFADGSHGSRLCPSYRGPWYEEELQRTATAVKLLQPSYLHGDIELWNWQGPIDAEKCTRCQADKEKSGIATWEEWKLSKGEQMWLDLRMAVQQAVQESGGPPCELGVYDFRPGRNYQFFWPFDRLYPDAMQSGQVSTYTPLEPSDLELVGNEVREDRAQLPRSDQLPWITPGDAGTFSGEAFYYALLEVLCNGSRGVNFWSSRVWDADLLAAYARAIRAVAPVEDTLIDGEPFIPEVDGPGRVSGMKRGDDIVLLVADYHGDTDGTVKVKLDLPKRVTITDLDRHADIGNVEAGPQVLSVKLDSAAAKVLLLKP